MNIHEYQARALLKAAGIPVLDGDVASTPTEAEAIARRLGGTVVIKAQVHAGGRGKAGGVQLAKTPSEALDHAAEILGMQIKGLTVQRVLVVPAAEIASESYLGLIMDRETQRPEQLCQAGEPGAAGERRHQVQQPIVRAVSREGLEQMLPGRGERGAVQVAGQVAAQLDGLPVGEARRASEPTRRGPGRVRRLLRVRLGLRPFLAVGPQLGGLLALDRLVLGRSVRCAELFAHVSASLRAGSGVSAPAGW